MQYSECLGDKNLSEDEAQKLLDNLYKLHDYQYIASHFEEVFTVEVVDSRPHPKIVSLRVSFGHFTGIVTVFIE